MTTQEVINSGKDKMEKAIASTKKEFTNIRTGRANPNILDKISVEYYGTPTPLRQLSNVSVQDGTTIVIQPYDRNVLTEIDKAILKSDLGITPNNDGNTIRLSFPPLTEDRRKELVKTVKKLGEDGKVAVRNIRRDMTDAIKKLEKSENLPEDEAKSLQDEIQKITDRYTREIDSIVSEKEKEVLTV